MPIVLINGPFGVGKSTAADLVVERLPSSMLFDPEVIGSVLHRLVGPGVLAGDYQDLRLWRHLTVDVAHRLHEDCKRDLIVPMCFWRYDYFREITDGFRERGSEVMCVRLTCTASTLTARILGRRDEDGGHAWCLAHLERGLAAANDPRFGIEVNTEGRTPIEVADVIVALISAHELQEPGRPRLTTALGDDSRITATVVSMSTSPDTWAAWYQVTVAVNPSLGAL